MRSRNAKAFTLVELLVAITILAVVGVAIGFAVQGSLTTYEQVNDIADVNQAARVLMARLGREIRAAEGATYTDTTSTTTLTLSYSATDTVYPNTIEYTINKTAGTMTRAEDSGSTTTLIGGTDDPLSVSDAEITVISRQLDIEVADGESKIKPCLVKIYLEFEAGGYKYPFSSFACLRKWVNEAREKGN